MDAPLEPGVETVVFMKAAQIGGSEALNNTLGYFIHQDPSPIILVQIGEKEAKAYSKERIQPMINDSPVLADRVADAKTRSSDNTTLTKEFRGGHLAIAGANAPAGLRSRARRILLLDEVDGYPPSAGTEGDPVELVVARSRTFWNRIVFLNSTPTLEGLSRIEAALKDCDVVRLFHLPCPHCQHEQHLIFSNLQWEKDKEGNHLPDTVQYACESCGALIDEKKKNWMLRNGRWVDGRMKEGEDGVDSEKEEWWSKAPGPTRVRSIGFQLNALYSPWMKWEEIVRMFLRSKGDPLRLQVFVNTVLGEVFREKGFRVDAHPLMARAEVYPAEPVPEGVLLITAGVDVQADRLEVELVGWGTNYESWSLDFMRIPGDPSLEGGVWDNLDLVLSKKYRHPSGIRFPVYAACVDSSYLTQTVYKYCSARQAARVWPIKGFDGEGRTIWDKPSNRNKFRVPMYPVGVDTAKGVIYSHLRIQKPDDWDGGSIPGFAHFPARVPYDEEYFRQLTSEKVVVRQAQRGHMKRQWIRRPGRRAEALDCRVYALAAHEGAYLAGIRLDQIAQMVKEGKVPGKQGRTIRHKGVGPG
jgi:phage terminase large subunit GpA-like protein